MQYQTPMVQDFGSIAAHTFSDQKRTVGPGHLDAFTECSGGSGDANYPTPCDGKGGPYDL